MSALFTGTTNYLIRTSGLPNIVGSDYTCGFWAKFNSIPNPTAYDSLWAVLDNPATYLEYVGIFRNLSGEVYLDVAGVGGTTPFNYVLGEWAYYSYQRNLASNQHRFRVNNTLIGSVTGSIAGLTSLAEAYLGSDTTTEPDLEIAYFFEDEVEYTTAQLLQQQGANAPSQSTIFTFSALASDFLDSSGNGHDWTEVGAVTFAAQPGIPGNTSPLTATELPEIPADGSIATITQDVTFNGVAYTVWFYYTGVAGDNELGAQGYGDFSTYRPILTMWTPDNATSAPQSSSTEKPVQFAITEGQTIWFQLNRGSAVPPATLTLLIYRFVDIDVPDGSIGVNDDSVDIDTLVLFDRTTDYQTRRFVQGIGGGENGDVLPNGILALEDEGSGTSGVRFYDINLDYLEIAFVAGDPTGVIAIRRSLLTNSFFCLLDSPIVTQISDAGVVMQSWTLPGLPHKIVPSPDETILYYTSNGSPANLSIKRWDLVNDIAMSDLVVMESPSVNGEPLCLPDGSVIVILPNIDIVRRYGADGTVLNNYSVGALDVQDHLAYDNNPAGVTFWLWHHVQGQPPYYDTFFNINVSNGAIVSTVKGAVYTNGVYVPDATLDPLSRFGHSHSCPFFIVPGTFGCPDVSQLVD